jgi:hypothetical protein
MSPPPEGENFDHLITGNEVSYISTQKKRSNSDATEYPRRRATIAVSTHAPLAPPGRVPEPVYKIWIRPANPRSARYADYARQDATELGQNASSAQILTPNAYIANRESNSTQETN